MVVLATLTALSLGKVLQLKKPILILLTAEAGMRLKRWEYRSLGSDKQTTTLPIRENMVEIVQKVSSASFHVKLMRYAFTYRSELARYMPGLLS